MKTFSNDLSVKNQIDPDLFVRLHVDLFEDSIRSLKASSTKKEDKQDIIAWILRPKHLYDENGRLVYDSENTPFSWDVSCKLSGVNPDAMIEHLVNTNILPFIEYDLSSYTQYLKAIKPALENIDQDEFTNKKPLTKAQFFAKQNPIF